MPASYFQLFAPLFLPLLLLPGAAPFVLLQPSPLPSASPLHSTPAPKAEPFYEVNVAYNKSTLLAYAPATSTFMPLPTPSDQQLTIIQFTAASLSRTFLPEGVSVDYYSFIRWRISQRFVSAILYVLGTQSLLIGLGVKSRNNFAAGAALNWILKDALGKIARVFWAGKMGRKFDSDAKRWRFRGTLLYALGNGLEIATFIYPSYFLLFAAFGVSLRGKKKDARVFFVAGNKRLGMRHECLKTRYLLPNSARRVRSEQRISSRSRRSLLTNDALLARCAE